MTFTNSFLLLLSATCVLFALNVNGYVMSLDEKPQTPAKFTLVMKEVVEGLPEENRILKVFYDLENKQVKLTAEYKTGQAMVSIEKNDKVYSYVRGDGGNVTCVTRDSKFFPFDIMEGYWYEETIMVGFQIIDKYAKGKQTIMLDASTKLPIFSTSERVMSDDTVYKVYTHMQMTTDVDQAEFNLPEHVSCSPGGHKPSQWAQTLQLLKHLF